MYVKHVQTAFENENDKNVQKIFSQKSIKIVADRLLISFMMLKYLCKLIALVE